MSKLRLSQIDELKEAIIRLPQKEKDKLLIRLINKDQMLIKQLHFQLLENENDLWDRHRELEVELHETFMNLQKNWSHKNSTSVFQLLLVYLREMSGKINEHSSITKSKDSELKLRMKVLRWSIEYFPDLYSSYHSSKYADKYFEYQKGRLKLCLVLYKKMHEDLRYEFKEDIAFVVGAVEDISAFKTLIYEFSDSFD